MNSQPSPPTLRGSRVTLRQARAEDIQTRLELGRNQEITLMYGGSKNTLPFTLSEATRGIEEMLSDPLAWVIDLNGSYIGGIWLFRVDDHDKRASLRIGINDPSKIGKGLGTESICLVLQFAFTVLDLHRVSVRVLDFNKRALRSYQKCGFRIEGLEREAALIDGKRYDDIMMGILRPEFQASPLINEPT